MCEVVVLENSQQITTDRYAIRNRPFWAESVSGDATVLLQRDHLTLIAIIDGAGHGYEAHRLSSKMKSLIEASADWTDPSALIMQLHNNTQPSIGAAVGIVLIDSTTQQLTFSGIGNIATYIMGGQDRSLSSRDGSVGQLVRRVNSEIHHILPGDIVLLHSDGIQSRFYTQYDPALKARTSSEILDYVFENFEKEHDDASCIVYRY